jgi:leader peptidase (prepilin peptidase)/N-methyltransferase
MDILFAVLASVIVFALGASIGSFINVIVYRLPAGLSILWPPSRCPRCLNQLKAYDNVPVFGWI